MTRCLQYVIFPVEPIARLVAETQIQAFTRSDERPRSLMDDLTMQ
jgi:hypothetical protein